MTDILGLLVVLLRDVRIVAGPRRREDDSALELFEYAVQIVFADQGFAGRLVDWAATTVKTTVQIVRKPAEQRGFAVHPER